MSVVTNADLDRAVEVRRLLIGYEGDATPIAEAIADERDRLLNTPILRAFVDGVVVEAQHQVLRWGSDHDSEKTPWDWFWLIGYLAQKAADAQVRGDTEKALHHAITTAAALANWHRQLLRLMNEAEGWGEQRPGPWGLPDASV